MEKYREGLRPTMILSVGDDYEYNDSYFSTYANYIQIYKLYSSNSRETTKKGVARHYIYLQSNP